MSAPSAPTPSYRSECDEAAAATFANEPPLRGHAVFGVLQGGATRLGAFFARMLPREFDPWRQTGAMANLTFILAVITGIPLLFFYSSSVHTAWESLENLSFFPQLLRSLHRYASDACMLFVLLHFAKMLVYARFSGPRWLTWVSGIGMLVLVWFLGWTGLWLIWDTQAKAVAIATVEKLDFFGLFSEPLARSFVTDSAVNSLLFFVILFLHILLPLAAAGMLLVHFVRVNRPRMLPTKRMTGLVVLALIIVGVVAPVYSNERAHMHEISTSFNADWWYMLPLVLADHLEGGAFWLVTLLGTIALVTLPFTLVRRRARVSVVDESRCNGCKQCYSDCPYNAIELVPVGDGDEVRARIEPSSCVGCGICTGSCDPGAITFEPLPSREARQRMREYFAGAKESEPRHLALLCARSAAANLKINAQTGECPQLPGYRVLALPCVGWVHPVLLELAARNGAAGTLVVSCRNHDPQARLGVNWLDARFAGKREPYLRDEFVKGMPVARLELDTHETATLQSFARGFRESGTLERTDEKPKPRRVTRLAIGVTLLVALAAVMVVLGRLPYAPPVAAESELVLKLRAYGEIKASEQPADESEESAELEDTTLLPHMRGMHVSRERLPVRIRVAIDGEVVHEQSYRPRGRQRDGVSLVLETLPVEPGERHVEVWLDGSADTQSWALHYATTLTIPRHERRIIIYDASDGFRYEPR